MNVSTYLFATSAAASGSAWTTLMPMMKLAREEVGVTDPMSIPTEPGSVPGGALASAARFRIFCSSGVNAERTLAPSMLVPRTWMCVLRSTSDRTD